MIIELNSEEYASLKVDVIERLRALREDADLWVAVDRTDSLIGGSRLHSYLEECISSPERHNLYELLAIPRFALFVARYFYFPEMVARIVRFFEALPQPSAQGRVYVKLSNVQVFQYASIYGFYTQAGKRLTQSLEIRTVV